MITNIVSSSSLKKNEWQFSSAWFILWYSNGMSSIFSISFFSQILWYFDSLHTHKGLMEQQQQKKIEKERILICQNDEIKLNFLSVCTEQKKMNKRMSFKLTYTWIMMMKIQTNGVNKSCFFFGFKNINLPPMMMMINTVGEQF